MLRPKYAFLRYVPVIVSMKSLSYSILLQKNRRSSLIKQPCNVSRGLLILRITLCEKCGLGGKWAHKDSNLGHADYESAALTS